MMMIIIIIIIIIYCNWVSIRWQWSVDLYKNRKETAQKEKQYTEQFKNNKSNTKTQNTQNRKQKYLLTYLLHGAEPFLRS